ncbi:VOC family protein [Nocardioides sp. TRM66260-LWL]|uniref:VOC family protein n=1 Tax=Nocardioides sp. TRM66260-LWL TaxID=2874478 RepID=UPI001CC521BA|nr:VOC family protein [Nocardioides sp. TRM66260-LWL]MBZ5736271.1 VOC family protein [Nocardioides sp. TRM66260-LWL]
MASRLANLCFDAHDTYAQAVWWDAVLDDFAHDPSDTSEGWNHPGAQESGLEGPDGRSWLFLAVPEGKAVKNRVHPCLRPTDRSRDEEVERLLAHGATLVADLRDGERGWAVLADPEGNELCVLSRLDG